MHNLYPHTVEQMIFSDNQHPLDNHELEFHDYFVLMSYMPSSSQVDSDEFRFAKELGYIAFLIESECLSLKRISKFTFGGVRKNMTLAIIHKVLSDNDFSAMLKGLVVEYFKMINVECPKQISFRDLLNTKHLKGKHMSAQLLMTRVISSYEKVRLFN